MTARVFVSPDDGRLRVPWRLLAFGLLSAVAIAGVPAVAYPVVSLVSRATGIRLIAYTWFLALGLLLATGAQLWWIERRPWSFVGLGRTSARPAAFARGTLLGALAIGVPSLGLLAAGWLTIEAQPPGGWGWLLADSLMMFAPAALFEELLCRGYVFTVLRDAWGWRGALLATSIVFGLLHLGNAGWTVEAIAMVMVAGVLLGGVRLATDSLYAAWAAHLSWNLVMAVGLHVAVSGFGDATPGWRVVDAGPAWATGGGWGPEGGAAAGLGMLAALGYLARYARRREQAS